MLADVVEYALGKYQPNDYLICWVRNNYAKEITQSPFSVWSNNYPENVPAEESLINPYPGHI